MAYITLAVTSRVIQQVKETGNPDQRQIAIQGASPELRAAIDTASAKKQVTVAVNDVFKLSIGDTDAIWRTHQGGLQRDDFDSLYDLLARRPDTQVRFACD